MGTIPAPSGPCWEAWCDEVCKVFSIASMKRTINTRSKQYEKKILKLQLLSFEMENHRKIKGVPLFVDCCCVGLLPLSCTNLRKVYVDFNLSRKISDKLHKGFLEHLEYQHSLSPSAFKGKGSLRREECKCTGKTRLLASLFFPLP